MKKLWVLLPLLAIGYWNNIFNIRSKYDKVQDFFEGFAIVELDGKYGFIDTSGKEVISQSIRQYLNSLKASLELALTASMASLILREKKSSPRYMTA